MQNRGSLVLRLATSGDPLADKRILKQWLHESSLLTRVPQMMSWKSSLWTKAAGIGFWNGKYVAFGQRKALRAWGKNSFQTQML